MTDKQFIAAKAVIIHEGKVLLLKESGIDTNARVGIWGVPGGRLEIGEPFMDALRREVKEETNLEIEIGSPIHMDEWNPQVKGEVWQIIGVFIQCTTTNTNVLLNAEHDAYVWVAADELNQYDVKESNKRAIQKLLS